MAITRSRCREGLSDKFFQAELADHGQDRLHVAVRERAYHAEGFGGGDEGLAFEGAADEVNEVIGEMGQVAESLMGDCLSLADGSSEQMGDVGLSVVDPLGRGHVYGAVRAGMRQYCREEHDVNSTSEIFSGYIFLSKTRLTADAWDLRQKGLGNSGLGTRTTTGTMPLERSATFPIKATFPVAIVSGLAVEPNIGRLADGDLLRLTRPQLAADVELAQVDDFSPDQGARPSHRARARRPARRSRRRWQL